MQTPAPYSVHQNVTPNLVSPAVTPHNSTAHKTLAQPVRINTGLGASATEPGNTAALFAAGGFLMAASATAGGLILRRNRRRPAAQ